MPDVTNRQEVQVKSTMKRPLTPARTAVSSKPTSTCWRGRGGKGALVHRGPDRTPLRPPWETAQRLPEKPKPEPARDLAIPLLSVSLKKTKNLIWKDTRTRVHCRVIHDSRDAGAPEGSRGMSGQSSGTATRADVARPQKGRHPATGNVDGHEGTAPSDVSQTEEDTTTRPRSHAELKKHVATAGCGHGMRPGGHESQGRPEPGDGVRRHDGQRQGGQSWARRMVRDCGAHAAPCAREPLGRGPETSPSPGKGLRERERRCCRAPRGGGAHRADGRHVPASSPVGCHAALREQN